MKRTLIACAVLLAILTLTAVAQKTTTSKSNDAEALLGAAIHQEEVEGNLDGAIASYKKFLSQYGNNRPLAAKAQYHMGLVYEKLGNAEARKAYEEVVQKYADQSDVVVPARRHLAALAGVRSSDTLAVHHLFTTHSFPASITSDGRLIGLADGYRSAIGIRDVASGQIKWLVDGDDSYTEGECTIISPDQRQVVYAWYPSKGGEVRIIANEVGSKPRILIPASEEYRWVDPLAWSPDGKSILIVINRRDKTWQFGWVAVADGTIRVLKSLEWRLQSGKANLSPDGKYIAYSALATNPSGPLPTKGSLPLDSTGQHIYVLAADGSSETDLTTFGGVNSLPIWTPDGAHILFISDRYGTKDLWTIPIKSGKATGPAALVKRNFAGWPIGMTRSGSYYYGEDASADLEQIIVVGMEPSSGTVRSPGTLTREPLIGVGPSWSPDGKLIALQKRRGNSEFIRVVHSLDSGEERVYAHSGIVAGPARWLSDSTGFLETIRNENGTRSIYRVDVKTGEFKPVLTVDPSPDGTLGQLSSDDKTFYVQNSDWDSIVAFDIATGLQRTVFKLPRTGKLGAFALSDDGRRLALAIDDGKGTVIASVSTNGSDYRELYSEALKGSVAWANGTNEILFRAFQDSSWKIMRISLYGGKPVSTGLERSTPIGWFSLNKDGSRLAFSTKETGGWNVFSLDNVMPALEAAK